MNELVILVFMACGQPVWVELIEPSGAMHLYTKQSVGDLWPVMLKDLEGMKAAGVPTVEYKVEDSVKLVCAVST